MKNDNWISVLERLPSEPQEIIIYFRNEAGWHTGSAYWDGESVVDLCEVCGSKKPYTLRTPVTYWQPLPEPPDKL